MPFQLENIPPFIYVLVFVAVFILLQTIAGMVFAKSDRTKRVNRRLSMLESGMDPREVYNALVRRPTAPLFGIEALTKPFENFDRFRRQAGVDIPALTLLGGATAASAAIWVFSLALLGGQTGHVVVSNAGLSLVGALVLSFASMFLWLNMQRAGRLKKLEEQLPIALDVVTRALRAGHPVVAAVHLAAQEMGDPLGSEFGLIVDETTYGGAFKDALATFAERTGSSDAHFFAVSVAIQSETGGNLAEILEGLSGVMRSRASLAKKVVALSSEGKASAYMLSALPILMIAFQMVANPTYYTSKFGDPIFLPVCIVVMALYFVGWLMVNRMINFKY